MKAAAGTAEFAGGVAVGTVQTVPDNIVGLWEGVKLAAKMGWNYGSGSIRRGADFRVFW